MPVRRSRLRNHGLFLVGLLGLLPACQAGFGSYPAPVAAVVGKAQITEAMLNSVVRIAANPSQVQSLLQGLHSSIARADAKRQVLSDLVQKEALSEQARRSGLAVTPTALDAALRQVKANFADAAAYRKALADSAVTEADLRAYQRLTLTAQLVQSRVEDGINAPASAIDAAYQSNKATFDAEFHPAIIRICSRPGPNGDCPQSSADLALAQQLIAQLQGGANFAALARQYSSDSSTRAAGGDMGWQDPGRLLPEFETAALALQPGQVSPQPVHTQFGYYVVELLGKGRSEADAAASINAQLATTARQQAFSSFLQQIMTPSLIQINPAFGQFDPSTLTVVPAPGSEPSPAPTSPAGAAGG